MACVRSGSSAIHGVPRALEHAGAGMKVLLSCQAGSGVGLGHLSRCLVVAKAIKRHFGAEVRLLVQSDPLDRPDLQAFAHTVVPPDMPLGPQLLIHAQAAELLLLDLQPQRVPTDLGLHIHNLRLAGTKVVAIDGLLAHRADLDLIFIPSFQFVPPLGLPEGAPVVHGWDCFLFDSSVMPEVWVPGARILALTGGSDATGLGATWPSLLNQTLPDSAEVHWVTGPFSPKPVWPELTRIDMVEHVGPAGLGKLMRRTNLAVTVFGVSFFELLYLGVPTVVFSPYGGKDSAEMSVIEAEGLALVASDEYEATAMLCQLMADEPLARSLSARARAKLAYSGAERLCAEVDNLMTH